MDEKSRYRKYIRDNRPSIIGLSILSCSASIIVVAFAYLSKLLLDNVSNPYFIWYAVATGVLLAAEVGCKFLYSYVANLKVYKTENAVKKQAFFAFLRKDYLSAEEMDDADVLNRLTSDCKVIAEGIITYIPDFAGLLTRIAASLAVLFFIDAYFAGGLLILGIAIYFATKLLRRRNKALHKQTQQAEGEVLSFYKEGIAHSFLFKLFSSGRKVSERCDEIQQKYEKARMRYTGFNIFVNTGFLLFMRASYLFAIIWSALSIAQGGSVGSLFAIIQLIAQIEGPFGSISGLIPRYFRTLGSVERVLSLETDAQSQSVEINAFDAPVKVDDITFGYGDGHTPLRGVSLEIAPGDFIAVVGGSGAGKSTLLKCIMGMYSPESGAVTYRGEDISRCQSLFTYVPQGNFLIPGSIEDNLLLFAPEAKREQIDRVLALTMLKDKIDSLPDKLKSSVSDFGAGLSEGEGQRLSIARALLVNRPVLVLDECTSALDEATEKAVLDNLVSLNKTIILVSHKPCATAYANKIIRLERPEKEQS